MGSRDSVRITKKFLKEKRACHTGLVDAAPFLPATIYTDVEKNLPLAIEMCEARVGHRADWLAGQANVNYTDYTQLWFHAIDDRDASAVAQLLAMAADKLLGG